jgi:hypothetical protein
MGAYQKQYLELEIGEQGRRLIDDSWVVRYFTDYRGEPPPREEVARHCRERLDELLFALGEALAENTSPREKAAFEVPKSTTDRLERIKFTVSQAKKDYASHRGLVKAIAGKLVPGEPLTPETLQEAVRAMKYDMSLKDWGHPSAREHGNSNENGPPASVNDSGAFESEGDNGSSEQPSGDGSASVPLDDGTASMELLKDERRAEAATGSGFAGQTLGRDTVRDRDEPPRQRAGR